MKNKINAIVLTLLIILSAITIIPNNYTVKAVEQSQELYVGGSGPSNYTKIQYALENASSGNTTVFIYTGTYSETLIINKTINITGEDTSNTIIDAGNSGCAVVITADWVNMSKFTIQNGGGGENDAGIKVLSNNTNISNNVIKNCDALGIYLDNTNNNTIYNNTFTNIINTSTIVLWNTSAYNMISKNNITNCGCAIDIGNGSHHNNISNNYINNNTYGIYIWINTTNNNSLYRNTILNSSNDGLLIEEAYGNKIYENKFKNNGIGISIIGQNSLNKNIVYHNNFINNSLHIYDSCNQTWDNSYPSGGNYWDDYLDIDMFSGAGQNESGSDGIWDTSYEIYYESTIDNYPLIYPWGEYSPVARITSQVINKTVSLNASKSYDGDGSIVTYSWDFGDTNDGTGNTVNHTFSQNGTYYITLVVTDDEGKNDTNVKYVFVGNDTIPPEINSVSNNPNTVGFGFNVTIAANVTDDLSGVETVEVNITFPDTSFINYTMTNTDTNIYDYNFCDTWQNGQYNYTIWVVDYANNTNISTNYSFNVSAQATISICTIKDCYGDNETINITDPPTGSSEIGYELLDDGKVLHIWNTHNNYYFNTSSGIQLTNHYNEYWSNNVLMLGYYNNGQWNLVYRTDELSGFNKNINSDNETYVNATLWKDLSYGGYDFRLALKYHLGVDDPDLTIIPCIKNLGEAIPYNLGFGWELKDIRIADVENDNYLQIYNGTGWEQILLSQTLDKSYTNMDHNTTIRLICTNPPTYHLSRELYLSWNENLAYKVTCKSRTGQNNTPVTLFIKIGTLDVDQEKYIELNWLDSDEWLGVDSRCYHSCCGYEGPYGPSAALDGIDRWLHLFNENHWVIIDLDTTYNIKKIRGRSNTMNDPTSVDIYISDDPDDWGSAVYSGITTWQDTTSWAEVDITDTVGRYINISITSTESGAGSNYLEFGGIPTPMTIFDVYGESVKTVKYYFNSITSDSQEFAWDTNPYNMVDGNTSTYASTTLDRDVEECTGNSCPGTVIGLISKVELRAYGYYATNQRDIILRPVFGGTVDGSYYHYETSVTPTWSPWLNITDDNNAPVSWSWSDIADLDCDVESQLGMGPFTLYCSKVEIRVSYSTIPVISNPVPADGESGVSTTPILNITVADIEGDTMNITWLSNSSGSWQTFGTNNSVSNGTYHQTMSNASVYESWWYWKVNVSDNDSYNISGVYKFHTGRIPNISNPHPTSGSTGVSLSPMLNITVSDPDGNNMTISWLSNSSGSWQTFGTNNSVGNGTYHQTFSNATINGQWWYWKVSVYDGTNTVVSSIFKFYTGNESKIKNTGSTDIKGYLLMQINYYNNSSQKWLIDQTVIDESTPRVINSGEQLGLDTVFNGLVNSWNLSDSNVSYKVYAALRDSDGGVLVCNDESLMEASYEFEVDFDTDSDNDNITDYMEHTVYQTNIQQVDTDNDGYNDAVDIDPLVDLEVTLTIKRINASRYTYTWREGEDWDSSETYNPSGFGHENDWTEVSDDEASNGYYTRQDDPKEGIGDWAKWDFTVNDPGVYHIWMRSHRYEDASSNIMLYWINKATEEETQIYARGSDHSEYGTEVLWYQDEDIPEVWKWSWYGVVNVENTGDYTLKIINELADDEPGRGDLGWHHGQEYYWMEVDNILITDDPNCVPIGKGIEGSTDSIIGYSSEPSWDDPGAGSAPDFYVKATIAGTPRTYTTAFPNQYNILSDYVFDPVNVPDTVEKVPIKIELWEDDGATDTLCDINGSSPNMKMINITYSLKNGTWWGDDHIGDTDYIGRSSGAVDGSWEYDAELIFDVSQNDFDSDDITFWRENNVFKGDEKFKPKKTNNRFAVIISGGANSKLNSNKNNAGNDNPWDGPNLLYEKGSGWTDYTFEVDLMTKEFDGEQDKENIGVMFRYQDSDNYYLLRWKRNGFRSRMYLDEIVNGDRSNICNKIDWLTRNKWYTLKITVEDDSITVNRIDNSNDNCRTVFDLTDDSHSSGSIGLFRWKNKQAWFDDIRVIDKNNGNTLLVEGFDYGIISSSDWTPSTSVGEDEWYITPPQTDQNDIIGQCDFIYRSLLLPLHYKTENIYYLCASKWRDVDCDGEFDEVNAFSMKSEIKEALKWLKEKSGVDDLNFVYTLSHGFHKMYSNAEWALNVYDRNRSGKTEQIVKDNEVAGMLKDHNYGKDIGRLVFLIDSCMIGHYIDALAKKDEDRIIITSSSFKEPAEMLTGQDWTAFAHPFFLKITDGKTNIAQAFNEADKYVETENFFTIDVIEKWNYTFWPQDARLDDNGNGMGSTYDLPKDGDWYDVYEGDYRNKRKETCDIPPNKYEYITKARIRFNVRLGVWSTITADLYGFKFFDCDSKSWKKPDGHIDFWNLWDDETKAYDGLWSTNAGCPRNLTDKYPYGNEYKKWFWTPFIELTLDNPIKCDKIKFKAWHSYFYCNKIDIDVYLPGYQEGILSGRTGL